jgi:diacylglycerol kinase family enzyme
MPSSPSLGVATLAANDLGLPRSAEIFTRAAIGLRHREATGIKLWTDYDSVSIDAEPATPFQADGELLGLAHDATLTPVEGAILVLRPMTVTTADPAPVTTEA